MGKTHEADVVEVCAGCGKVLELTSGYKTEGKPKPGDLSVCFGCCKLTVFDENLERRDLTEEEQADADADPHVREAIDRLKRFLAKTK